MRVQADRGSFGLIQQTNGVKLVVSRSGAKSPVEAGVDWVDRVTGHFWSIVIV